MSSHGTAPRMSFGQFREFAGAVVRSLPGNISIDVAQKWIQHQEALRKQLYLTLSSPPLPEFNVEVTCPVIVNYERIFLSLVDAHEFEVCDSNIRTGLLSDEYTSSDEAAALNVHFARFNEIHKQVEMVAALYAKGLRPATAKELLHLFIDCPLEVRERKQRLLPVIALGSWWERGYSKENRRRAYLKISVSRTPYGRLEISLAGDGTQKWTAFYSFAAVSIKR